jgi:hypothetical protein
MGKTRREFLTAAGATAVGAGGVLAGAGAARAVFGKARCLWAGGDDPRAFESFCKRVTP